MTIKPIGANLLVTPLKKETVSASGLILSTKEDQRINKGTVIGVGKDVDEDIVVGDIVHFPVYAPDELEINDEKYLVINQKSILGVEK